MPGISSTSGLSNVICGNKLSSVVTTRRDKILGISVSSNTSILPSLDSHGNFLSEEEIWNEDGEEVRSAGIEDEDYKPRDAYSRDYVKTEQPEELTNMIGGNRFSLVRDKDPVTDLGLARGLSLFSQMDRGLGVPLGHDSKPSRVATASWMIPLSQSVQKHKNNEESGQIKQQSAPVDVPDWSKILGDAKRNISFTKPSTVAEDDDEDDERLPPHELLAKEYASSHFTTFSVFEGVGRTLKGRDMSRVRNAVLQRTGFLDF